MSQTLLIPGLDRLNPLDLFSASQPGGWVDPYDLTKMWVDDAGTTPATIASLGTGIGRVVTKGNAITLVQANAADRPVWGRHPVSGIRQLLSYTESLTNAYWSNAIQGTGIAPIVTPNFEQSPYGPATRLQLNLNGGTTSNDRSGILSSSLNLSLSQATYSRVYFKALSAVTDTQILNSIFGGIAGGQTFGTPGSKVITDMGNGWKRLDEPFTMMASGGSYRFQISGQFGPDTLDILVAAPQAELGSTATTYQRVTNRFDITEVGSPSLYYFSGNGVNQRWASNATVDFSGTDKVTVWAWLRALVGTPRGIVCELTNSTVNNSGGFGLNVPSSNLNDIFFGTAATAGDLTLASGSFTPPATLSLVGESSISGDFVRLRVNGVLSQNTADKGSGNHANATMHVFSRAGSSLFFNGLCYGLLFPGDNYDSRTIQRFSDYGLKPRRLITA